MNMLAVITARGGSKRIPGKNIKDFCGRPIIAYSIENAIQSSLFDEVMVSTEDEEIAQIARHFGAKIPFMRSKEKANDYAGSEEVVMEVVNMYEERGRIFKDVCCIYPTAPLVTADLMCQAYEKFKETDADALLPVLKFSFPPQRAFTIEEGALAYRWPEFSEYRSQDLKPLYHDAGAFYYIKTDVLMREKTLIPENTGYFVLDEIHVQDIDNVSDWELAEIKYRYIKESI